MDQVTFLKMKMKDGTEVSMTLSFGRLYKLRQKAPEIYEKYNRIAMDGMKDEFHFVTYLYTAYVCANIENVKGCMSEEEFIDLLPDNHVQLIILSNQLRFGDMKKKQDSGIHSLKRKQKKESESPNFS